MGKAQTIAAAPEGGCLPWAFLSDGSAKAGVIKASPGQLYGLTLGNVNAAACYVKLYDKISAPTTSDTPVYRLMVPGSTAGGGREKAWPLGLRFAVGIAYRIVTTAPDNGDTACASNEVTASGDYK